MSGKKYSTRNHLLLLALCCCWLPIVIGRVHALTDTLQANLTIRIEGQDISTTPTTQPSVNPVQPSKSKSRSGGVSDSKYFFSNMRQQGFLPQQQGFLPDAIPVAIIETRKSVDEPVDTSITISTPVQTEKLKKVTVVETGTNTKTGKETETAESASKFSIREKRVSRADQEKADEEDISISVTVQAQSSTSGTLSAITSNPRTISASSAVVLLVGIGSIPISLAGASGASSGVSSGGGVSLVGNIRRFFS